MSRRRRLLLLLGKLAVAALLIGWLMWSGTLDMSALALFFERPLLLAANLVVLAIGAGFGALRWRLLLRLAGVELSVGRALQLHLTAIFFNVALPGNIGGDVLKSVYVARDAAPHQRPAVYLIALVDRAIALAGLVAIAFVLTLVHARNASVGPAMAGLSQVVVVLTIVTFGVPLILLMIVRRYGERLRSWTGGSRNAFARMFERVIGAAQLVAQRPKVLLAALGFAVVVHTAGMALFAALATAITVHDVSLTGMAAIYPLGLLSTLLPISYAGFGVGHIAFDQLFSLVGLSGGATVFNVYAVGQTTPCLLGVLPYLSLRREAPLSEEG